MLKDESICHDLVAALGLGGLCFLYVWSFAFCLTHKVFSSLIGLHIRAKVERSVLYIKCFSGVWSEEEMRNGWVKITRRQLKCNLKKMKGEFP